MNVYGKDYKMAEINFLCVHKKLRAHRIAPVLIKEVTRRVNLKGIWQAIYTAGVQIPTPISTAKYYHRNLNFKKLVDVGFTSSKPGVSKAIQTKLYKLPAETQIKGIRPMVKKDAKAVHELLSEHVTQFKVHMQWSYEEVLKHLKPRDGVIYSYVVENEEGEITDFVSFYSLPSSVLKSEHHKRLEAAYAYYTVAKGNSLTDLMKDALILANNAGFDVFNCLNVMNNEDFLEELKFGAGDGSLHYYLYNYRTAALKPSEIGIVLV
jgi:glycylpeptide N-tetradecanoyltransferase